MEISVKLKERFCKDYKIPINIFNEPYFSNRLELLDPLYGTIQRFETFVKSLEDYKNEQDYFEHYNSIKDAAINSIKNTQAFQRFNSEDMNKYAVDNYGVTSKDIFKPSNDGKYFISIDMTKANFSALMHYDKSIFLNADGWESFMGLWTNNIHIIDSKYIRQVILGNCNPKRQVTYEKYLMSFIMKELVDRGYLKDIVFYSNDEIVLEDTKHMGYNEMMMFRRLMQSILPVPIHLEHFRLFKIKGCDGYVKRFVGPDGCTDSYVEFKCVNAFSLPFIMRSYLGQEVTEFDKVFYHEGRLSKYIEIPEVEVPK